MNNKYHIKGFTLIELLISTGILSVAAFSIYGIANIAYDWRKSSKEVVSINFAIKEMENASISTGKYQNISLSSLPTHFVSALNLQSVQNTSDIQLSFNYSDISERVCNDFVSKILSSSKNFGAIINGQVTSNNLADIATQCEKTQGKNEVNILFNKEKDAFNITTITASVNVPPPPPTDVVIPAIPTPAILPTVPAFIPPTTTPITYGITGAAPIYPVVAPSGGPISVTPGTGSSNVTPPNWTPPGYTPAPPATGTPVDDIDQDVLPPPPPPPPPPAAPPDDVSLNFNTYCHSFTYLGIPANPTCVTRNGTYNTKVSAFNYNDFRYWALMMGSSICPYPYSASDIYISLYDLDSDAQAVYQTSSWFPPYIPSGYVTFIDASLAPLLNLTHGTLSVTIHCSGF